MMWSHPESDQATKGDHQNKRLQTHTEQEKPGQSLATLSYENSHSYKTKFTTVRLPEFVAVKDEDWKKG